MPVLDEADRLPSLLADLAGQTRAPAEVVVVDGGSADGSVALAAAAGAQVLHAPRGIARQRNAGAARATGDLLLLVDADVRLPPDTLERMVEEVLRRDLDAACPRYRPATSSRAVRGFFAVMNAIFAVTAPVAASGGGMCILIRRDLFEHLDGFDVRYRFEDAELLRRAGRAARYRTLRVPVDVSDRRFRRDGVGRTIGVYAAVGVLVALGWFRVANLLDYGFGAYPADGAVAP